MATLRFDGASDAVNGASSGPMTGALSMAGLLKRSDTGPNTLLFFHQPGSPNAETLVFQTLAAGLSVYVAGYGSSSSPGWFSGTGEWWLIAFTRTAGATTPRFHFKNLTTGGAWLHDVGGAPLGNPAASGGVRIGIYQAGGGGNDLAGDVALAAYWDGTTLTDPQVEQLAVNARTSDWHALAPTSLTELTSLTPTDIEGRVTWTVSGPTLTGTDPPWTFDSVGGPSVATARGSYLRRRGRRLARARARAGRS